MARIMASIARKIIALLKTRRSPAWDVRQPQPTESPALEPFDSNAYGHTPSHSAFPFVGQLSSSDWIAEPSPVTLKDLEYSPGADSELNV